MRVVCIGFAALLVAACSASPDAAPSPAPAPFDPLDVRCDFALHPDCLSDDFGLFVDGDNGDDRNPGTRASPLRTFDAALAHHPRAVVACATSYDEPVVDLSREPVVVRSGVRCGDFVWSGGKAAVRGVSVAGDTLITDLHIEASRGKSGRDATGVFALGESLEVVRCDILVGPGGDASDDLSTVPFPASSSFAGGDANGGAGGLGGSGVWCGLKGGAGGGSDADGHDAIDGDGTGGSHALCIATGQSGGRGADGADGADAIDDGEHWRANEGRPGMGGGGGGGGNQGGGGGGGAGGCGGEGGRAGAAGGVSLGIATYRTNVVLRETHIVTSDAGRAANGQPRSDGMPGGSGGGGASDGCAGGAGGRGGHGGAGVGGVGGSSAGVGWYYGSTLWHDDVGGTLVRDAATTIAHGRATPGGMGGHPSMGRVADGLEGDAIVLPGPRVRPPPRSD